MVAEPGMKQIKDRGTKEEKRTRNDKTLMQEARSIKLKPTCYLLQVTEGNELPAAVKLLHGGESRKYQNIQKGVLICVN